MITIGELILGAYVYDGTGITVESGESARFLHKDMYTSSTILADLGARGIEWIPTSQKCEVCLSAALNGACTQRSGHTYCQLHAV